MGRQQPDIFSDPRAGTPLRGAAPKPADDDPRFSDPRAGEPLRVATQSAPPGVDALEALLRRSPLSDRQRAGLWDIYEASKNADDLAGRLKSMELPSDLKAQLWDLKAQAEPRRYVSTDPNFGVPLDRKYVSTDPNFGDPLRVGIRAAQTERNRALDALPTIGGMAGGLLGGSKLNPMGMLLAATGGAGGEAVRQTLASIAGRWDEVPPDVQAQMQAIISEGVKQGGMEGIGRYVLGPITKLFGRALYRSALKPPKDVRADFGAKEVTNTLVDAGVPITRNEAGTAKVEALLKAAGQDTAHTIKAAEVAGAKPVNMRPVVGELQRTRDEVSKRVVRGPGRQEVDTFRDAALKENPNPVALTQAQGMKQAEQDLALKAYRAEARGAPVNSIETAIHEDLARGLREAIERRVPGVRGKNKRTQDLIGALKAITAAEGRIANNNLVGIGDALALGAAGVGYAAGGPQLAALGIVQEVLTRPEIASRLGIALDRAGKPQITPQALRALSEAVNQLTAGSARSPQ